MGPANIAALVFTTVLATILTIVLAIVAIVVLEIFLANTFAELFIPKLAKYFGLFAARKDKTSFAVLFKRPPGLIKSADVFGLK